LFKEIVDRIPGKDEIIAEILDNAPLEIQRDLDEARSKFRGDALFPKQMNDAALRAYVISKIFPKVRETFEQLVKRGYSVVVASLTDEDRIESALRLADIPYVGIIVGRDEYKDRELGSNISEKTFPVRKVGHLSGIPANRVLYIGDPNNDEFAAREAGAAFVYARLVHGMERPEEHRQTLHFNDYSRLPALIDEAEGRIRASESVPHRGRNY
jgi:phosphoglycolate phosphatase-like HAD superfamily hydrolase